MKAPKLLILLLLFASNYSTAQTNGEKSDSTINNLAHISGYQPSLNNAIPQYNIYGSHGKSIILIPGWGFDASVFKDFIDANQNDFIIYAVTIPGFGKTQAPAMPPAGTSYGEHSWNKSAEEGIIKLIEKEKIIRPVIVGHFVTGTQIATELAARYPEKIGALVLVGGPAKFISIEAGKPKDYALTDLIRFTDSYTAPVMFKAISKLAWDAGNYLPVVYSIDSTIGNNLWKMSADVPMPVMIRYLCEYIASDVSTMFNQLKCPVLILRPTFNSKTLEDPINNYLKPQFIDKWDSVKSTNNAVKIVNIHNAGIFVWKDAPDKTYSEIRRFTASIH